MVSPLAGVEGPPPTILTEVGSTEYEPGLVIVMLAILKVPLPLPSLTMLAAAVAPPWVVPPETGPLPPAIMTIGAPT